MAIQRVNERMKERSENLASGPYRLIAAFADLILALALHHYALSHLPYRNFEWQLFQFIYNTMFLQNLSSLHQDALVSIVMVYMLHIALRFYSTVLLGVSFNQFILGMRGGSGFIWNRLGGAARVIFEVILTPFVLFDIACWWDNPTLKEHLTWTRIIHKKNKLRYFVLILFIPFYLLLAFYSSLFFNLTLFDGVKVEILGPGEERLSHESNFKSFRHFSSNHFRFQAFSSLEKEGRFILLPNFEILALQDTETGKQKKRIYPNLLIYDQELKTYGVLKITKKFSMLDLMKMASRGDPFFSLVNPELGQIIQSSDSSRFVPTAYDASYKANTLFHEPVKREIRRLIRDAFTLSVTRMPLHILQNGPFVRGHVLVRNELLKMIPAGEAPIVSFVKMGNYEFIRLRQSFNFKGRNRRNEYETLIPLDTNSVIVYEFNYADIKKSPKSWNMFQKDFWASVEWYLDYLDIFTFPQADDDLEPLHIVDHFVQGKLSDVEKKRLEDYFYHYSFDLAKNALKKNDEDLQKLLLVLFRRYREIWRLKNLQEKGFYSEEFGTLFKSLQDHLEFKRLDFFQN